MEDVYFLAMKNRLCKKLQSSDVKNIYIENSTCVGKKMTENEKKKT